MSNRIARDSVVDVWDHAFLVYKNDVEVLDFLNSLPNHKTVIFPSVPTAENMAAEAFRILKNQYKDTYGNHLKLERVRLFETPNSWADALCLILIIKISSIYIIKQSACKPHGYWLPGHLFLKLKLTLRFKN